MEKYREAIKYIMEFVEFYRKHGISCEAIYGEMSAKLSGVRTVASYDPSLLIKEYDEIAEEIENIIEALLEDYRKELGFEDKQ